MTRHIVIASGLWLLIAFTPSGALLEASLTGHVIIEIPLLVLVGVILGNQLKPRLSGVLHIIDIPCILLTCFTLAFWMIPRWLDASLNDPVIANIKYLSLPLLAGIPLALSWRNLHFIARGLVKIEFLAMLFRLGWVYLISPDRLCNNYLLSEQQQLGYVFIFLGFVLGIIWLIQVFFIPAELKPDNKLFTS